jgi:predicted membrane channel-forming protein YqfA (hemolysin III family)
MEHKEPSCGETSEQEASSEKYEQEAEQLLELHRRHQVLSPSLFLGMLSAYMLFITAVAAVGAIAFSSGHITTLEIVFFTSVALLLFVPVSVIWYLRVTFRKTSTKKTEGNQDLGLRLAQSFLGTIFVRLANNRIFKLLGFVLPICMITFAIMVVFPRKPRFSLGIIVFYTTIFVFLMISEVWRQVASAAQTDVKEIWEFNKMALASMQAIGGTIPVITKQHEELAERHEKLVEAHIETNKLTVAAIVATNEAVRVTAGLPAADQMEGEPEPINPS